MDQFLETNGLGGFSSSTLCGVRQCPSQGLVVVAKNPPVDRYVLVNGFEVIVSVDGEIIPLSTNQLGKNFFDPDARSRLLHFDQKPWPVCRYDLGEGRELEFECLAHRGTNQFVFCWQLTVSDIPITLSVRPLLSGRPMDATRTESTKMSLKPSSPGSRQFVWSLRAGAPALALLSDGVYTYDPQWVKGLYYQNGSMEDLAAPCDFQWFLKPRQRAHIVASTEDEIIEDPHTKDHVALLGDKLRKAERTRRGLFRTELDRAADQYIVSGKEGRTFISGYPQGTEKGAPAMIAVRGISLSPGRLDVASEVLSTWRERLATGLLPSEISEQRRDASFATPEPSLWYIIAAYEYSRAAYRQGRILEDEERQALETSIDEILSSFANGLHKRVYMDEDGLLAEASPEEGDFSALQVEKRAHIQALWISALRIGDRLQNNWADLYQAARKEFDRSFWNYETGHLYRSILQRKNRPIERAAELSMEQILAVGGLPIVCVAEDKASLLVHALEQRLIGEKGLPRAIRLPWLFGPFVEAWYRVHHQEPGVREQTWERFLAPWKKRLDSGSHGDSPDNSGRDGDEALSEEPHASFSSIETSELLRVLHLPDLMAGRDPFDDSLSEPLFY